MAIAGTRVERTEMKSPRRRRAVLGRMGFALLVGVILAAALVPFAWVVAQSLQSSSQLARGTAWLPSHPTLHSYRAVLQTTALLRPLLNSALVALGATAASLVLGGLAGYALGRLPVRGRGLILAFVLGVGFFPVVAMVGPLFLVFRDLHLLDSLPGLAFSYLIYTLPIVTWLLTGFFAQVPRDLEEAAMVDGATRLQALWRVVIPISLPAVMTAAILSFVLALNDFLFALSFLQTPSNYTAPLAIVNLGQSQYQVFYNRIDAAVVVVTVPVALLVVLAQRRIVAGLTAGGVK